MRTVPAHDTRTVGTAGSRMIVLLDGRRTTFYLQATRPGLAFNTAAVWSGGKMKLAGIQDHPA